jgi:hypothetical protein
MVDADVRPELSELRKNYASLDLKQGKQDELI